MDEWLGHHEEWLGHQRDHRRLMLRFSDAITYPTCASVSRKNVLNLVCINEG
jgi:hypothetical protein